MKKKNKPRMVVPTCCGERRNSKNCLYFYTDEGGYWKCKKKQGCNKYA